VFISFLAYCLYVTLGRQLKSLAPGLTSRSALEMRTLVLELNLLPRSGGDGPNVMEDPAP
jgi:hypothetical protein